MEAAQKHIIAGKVQTSDNQVFTVQGVGSSEQDVILDFGSPVSYQVVKLDVADLPPQASDKKNITWINNFGVQDSNGNYLPSVNYTVFLPARAHATFVYDDQRGLHQDKTPGERGSKPPRPGMVQVDLTTGDPGIGWK